MPNPLIIFPELNRDCKSDNHSRYPFRLQQKGDRRINRLHQSDRGISPLHQQLAYNQAAKGDIYVS
jgi:hypothetical protein